MADQSAIFFREYHRDYSVRKCQPLGTRIHDNLA